VAAEIDLSGMVSPIPAGAPPIKVKLPGGLEVSGLPSKPGANAMEQVRAFMSAANAALAPLGPFFKILEALMSLKDFVSAVPKVVTNPGKVIKAAAAVLKKIAALAPLVPQLSVPFTILGVVDAILTLLEAIVSELNTIVQQAQRIEDARAASATTPALLPIIAAAEAQLAAQQGNLAQALAAVTPLVEVINMLTGLIGLPKLPLAVDMTGSAADAIGSLNKAVQTLRQFRSTIPV
jgi:hypothetical protein